MSENNDKLEWFNSVLVCVCCRSHSSCDIVINDPKPGSSERIISITGSASNIQVAQSLMQNR